MTRSGTVQQWYRFLEATSEEEAASELKRHIARLEGVYEDLDRALKLLAYSPGREVDEALYVSRTSLGEAVSILHDALFRVAFGDSVA